MEFSFIEVGIIVCGGPQVDGALEIEVAGGDTARPQDAAEESHVSIGLSSVDALLIQRGVG